MIVAKIVLPNFDTLLPSWNTKQQAANASVSTLEHMILILYIITIKHLTISYISIGQNSILSTLVFLSLFIKIDWMP
jgi:hypothetical protein